MLLSVVIVNYNVKYFLEQCILSVHKALSGIEGEIIVVDNHSTDGSQSFFSGKFPEVQFIWKEENVGFAKANNEALQYAKGDYILFLNPDTIVPEDCFKKCISFIQNKNNQCAIGIKMLDGSGKFLKESKRGFPNPLTALYKIIGLASLFPTSKIFARYHLGHLDQNKNHEVDVLAGAFLMMPREILKVVKGFDEEYFMYGEDVDLSFRIQQAGFKNFYFSESSIIHFKGESTKKGSLNYVKLFYSAMSIFAHKHYGNARAGVLNFFIQTAIFLRALAAAFSRFLKWVGIPVVDAVIILLSFILAKNIWEAHLHYEMNYSINLLIVAFPAFTLLFLFSSYFSGLYENGFYQAQLNKSTITAVLLIFSLYAVIPEQYRYSRVVMLMGILLAFIFMSLLRVAFLRWGIVHASGSSSEGNFVGVVGDEKDISVVDSLMNENEHHLRAHLSLRDLLASDSKKTFSQFVKSFPDYLKKEIIFCEGGLSVNQILLLLPLVPKNIEVFFCMSGSHSLVGSKDPDAAGMLIQLKKYQLGNGLVRRNKRIADIFLALIFLISFPLQLFIKRRPFAFLKNCVRVLLNKRTWVGYASRGDGLPLLKPGIIHTSVNFSSSTDLSEQFLRGIDQAYASNYSVGHDFKIILAHYDQLS